MHPVPMGSGNRPEVSVIIPTYERPEKLIRAIRSVLEQEVCRLEVIVVDDHSMDDTGDVVIGLGDPRVMYLKQQERRGSSQARNVGLELAKGDFIAFLDDDDFWLPGKLSAQLRAFSEDNGLGIVYTGYEIVLEADGSTVMRVEPDIEGDVHRTMIRYNFIGSPTPLIRRSVLNASGGFDPALTHCQDWDLWIRATAITRIRALPQILAVYSIHGDQKSTALSDKILGREAILEKYRNEIGEDRRAMARHLGQLGAMKLLKGDISGGRKALIGSITCWPLQWRSVLYLLTSSVPSLAKKLVARRETILAGNIRIV